MHLRFLGANGFHVKEEEEIFSVADLLCRRTSNMKISRRHLLNSYVRSSNNIHVSFLSRVRRIQ